MIKLDSIFYHWYYRLRRALPFNMKVIPHPITWREPRMTLPSKFFLGELNEEENKKITQLMKEAELISRIYNAFPKNLTDKHWEKLLELKCRKDRLEYLKFIKKNEMKDERDRKMKVQKQQKMGSKTYDSIEKPMLLNPHHEKLERWKEQVESMKFYHALRLQELPKIAVDCRFIPYLSHRAQNLTSVQLSYMVADNRRELIPWPLYFVNFDTTNKVIKECKRKHLQALDNERKLMAIATEKNYTEIFDPKKIIYLSPDAEEALTKVESDKTYIIGGIVDRVAERNIPRYASLEMSQVDGIQSYRLPLNEYVKWEAGTQFLTLTTVMKMLKMTFENGNNWKETMERLVPKRYVTPPNEKNPAAQHVPEMIHRYNLEIYRILEEHLGKEEKRIFKKFKAA